MSTRYPYVTLLTSGGNYLFALINTDDPGAENLGERLKPGISSLHHVMASLAPPPPDGLAEEDCRPTTINTSHIVAVHQSKCLGWHDARGEFGHHGDSCPVHEAKDLT